MLPALLGVLGAAGASFHNTELASFLGLRISLGFIGSVVDLLIRQDKRQRSLVADWRRRRSRIHSGRRVAVRILSVTPLHRIPVVVVHRRQDGGNRVSRLRCSERRQFREWRTVCGAAAEVVAGVVKRCLHSRSFFGFSRGVSGWRGTRPTDRLGAPQTRSDWPLSPPHPLTPVALLVPRAHLHRKFISVMPRPYGVRFTPRRFRFF